MINFKIKELRELNNMSQNNLADKVGVSRVAISRYENGEREPRQEILLKIARALNVSLKDLYPNDYWNEFDSEIDHDKIISELKECELLFELLRIYGHNPEVLTENEYGEFVSRLKKFIDFEFYSIRKK